MTAWDWTTAHRILTPPTEPFTSVAFGDVTLTTSPAHPVSTYNGHPAIPRATGEGAQVITGPPFTPAVNFVAFIAVTGPSEPSDPEWILAGYGPFEIGLTKTIMKTAYVHGHGSD